MSAEPPPAPPAPGGGAVRPQGRPGRPAAGTHRLFLALWPDDSTRDAIRAVAADLQRTHAPGGRAVAPSRYHVTLHFFGDFAALSEPLLTSIAAAMARVRAPAFELALERAGHFGRVGWIGPTHTPQDLKGLWQMSGEALSEAGVATRGHAGFVPHLTLFRDMRAPLPPVHVPCIRWTVDRVVLIDSRHGPDACYVELASWPLGPRAG